MFIFGRRPRRPPPPSIMNPDSDDTALLDQPKLARIVLPTNPAFHCSINGRNRWNVYDVYEKPEQQAELGQGTFGKVYLSHHRSTDGRTAPWYSVAIKETKPNQFDLKSGVIYSYDNVELRCQEVRALIHLRQAQTAAGTSSHVLHLHEYFWAYNPNTGRGQLHLVTELLGQELNQWRASHTVLLESSIKSVARVVLKALDFMARAHVVHRDIKPMNILFRVNGDVNTLKIVDFGLAKVLDDDQIATGFCGTPGYLAPEMYQGQPYRYEVDMFAFGVVLFRLLSGTKPFATANGERLRMNTINLKYTVEGRNWEGVSTDARQLVRNLLIGKGQRYTAEQALNHKWFSESVEDSELSVDNAQWPSYAPGESRRSNAIALSRPPSGPQAVRDGIRFWLDGSVWEALDALKVEGKYEGRILDFDDNGYVFVEEAWRSSNQFILADHVASSSRYTEKDCRRICLEIAHIIKLSHDNGMAHRNLHLNNFVVDQKGNLLVKGLQHAEAINEDQPMTGHFGYLYSWYAFKAPEIDNDFVHDKSVDLWSFGVIIYMLLTGMVPFRGEGDALVTNKHGGNFVFEAVIPSEPAQRLVTGLLQVIPENRLTIEQVLDSEWMIEAEDVLDEADLYLARNIMTDWNTIDKH